MSSASAELERGEVSLLGIFFRRDEIGMLRKILIFFLKGGIVKEKEAFSRKK